MTQDFIDETFGPGGHLAQAFPGYETRSQQVAVARAIDATIRSGTPVLVEASTGTGKSVAALVPAIWHATVGRDAILARRPAPEQQEGELSDMQGDDEPEEEPVRVLYATANIALQEQVIGKDVPALQRALPWPFLAAIMKGRANFLCHAQLDDAALDFGLVPPTDSEERRQWLHVAKWSTETETGDFSELPFELKASLKPKLAVSADDCIGPTCPRRQECFPERMRKRAKAAQIIVCNDHLLCAHLALAKEGAKVLPYFDIVIADECFPAGTRVGMRPIEQIRVGDIVPSFDEEGQVFVERMVLKVMANKPRALVRLRFGEKLVVCTPGHPFFTARGWVQAIALDVGDLVLSSEHATQDDGLFDLREPGDVQIASDDAEGETEGTGLLLAGAFAAGTNRPNDGPGAYEASSGDALHHLRGSSSCRWAQGSARGRTTGADLLFSCPRARGVCEGATDFHRDVLLRLREDRTGEREGDERRTEAWSSLLFPGACEGGERTSEGRCKGSDGSRYEGENRRGEQQAHARNESNASSGDSCTTVGYASTDGTSPSCSRGQRAWAYGTANATSIRARAGMGSGAPGSGQAEASRLSVVLPDRHRESGADDRGGGGRLVSQFSEESGAGCSQRDVSSWARLDGVEVLEPGGDGTFGGACPDGLVYNLEVEGTHTYIAEGLVVHNCHQLAEIARSFFGFRAAPGQIRHAARLLVPPKNPGKKGPLPEIDRALREDIDRLSDDYFGRLADYRRSPRYHARLTEPGAVDSAGLVDALRKAATLYGGTMANAIGLSPARKTELQRAIRRARILANQIERATKLEPPAVEGKGEEVFYIEEESRGDRLPPRITLAGEPLDVAPILRAELFESGQLVAVAGMSATLSTGGVDGFSFSMSQLGATAADELAVGSPFDLKRNCLLVIPRDAPDPARKDFNEAAAHAAVKAMSLANGRTLALFSSYRGMKLAAELARVTLGDRYVVLVQGDAPRTQLIERFRRDVSSVLLGTKSLWEGVDIQGEALSCVVIDRVPFDPPDSPILDALSERSSRTFAEYSIPRAAIALKQAFGRLVRSKTDRGVVVMLDRRLTSKGWGKKILRAIPDCARSDDLQDVQRFLDEEPEAAVPDPGEERQAARPTRTRSAAGTR